MIGRRIRYNPELMSKRLALGAVLGLLVGAILGSACAVVPQNRRKHLADPTMQGEDSSLEAGADRKLHTAREGAGGGDGTAAGGGCGCSN
jgi:hypothetical protein